MSQVRAIEKDSEARRNAGGEAKMLLDEEKWQATLARDSDADGTFVFAVRSTGIYCRPSCPARHPKREQVTFFQDANQAELSGYRPCLRCRPKSLELSPQVAMVDRVCKFIEKNLFAKLTLSMLSADAGVSSYHLQRTFKKMVGISPRQYAEGLRMAKLKHSLRNGETVTKALYEAGFSSRSRLYEKAPIKSGLSPGAIRRGGLGMRIEYTIVKVPLGRLLLGFTARGICAVCMGDSDSKVEAALSEDYPLAEISRNDTGLNEWANDFVDYFGGRSSHLSLPIDVRATAFQWRVWKEIQAIPYGSTASYLKIARALGSPQSVRAVARACATNPVALAIPCHRVIGENGKLHGYRWGKKRKEALLLLEQKAHSKIANSR